MIPYYKQLDKPNDCRVIMKEESRYYEYDKETLTELPISFFKKYEDLFKQFKLIDNMAASVTFIPEFTYEEWESKGIIMYPGDGYPKNYSNLYMTNNRFEIEDILRKYSVLARNLIELYPIKKEQLMKVVKEIDDAEREITKMGNIKIKYERESKFGDYDFPNCWFITPSNYLYNALGPGGHTEGNFTYAFMHIVDSISTGKPIEKHNSSEITKRIIKEKCVIYKDFREYANPQMHFVFVHTPQTEAQNVKKEALKREIELLEEIAGRRITSEEQYELWAKYGIEWSIFYDRSYQPNARELTVGFFKARDDLYNSMLCLNDSNQRVELYDRICKMCRLEMDDVLVRFCGFSKISSVLPKTIVTSRFAIYDDFIQYLERGWNIQLISPIVYDKIKDDIKVVNTEFGIVGNYLEENEEKYPQFKKQIIR